MIPEQKFDLQSYFIDQDPEILKKPVEAVHMVIKGGIQNKTQKLAWNAMLKHAHEVQSKAPEGVQIQEFEMSRTELMKTIGWTSRNRKALIENLQAMQDLKVTWDVLSKDGESKWASCVLLPFVAFDRDKIYYSYVSQIIPHLFNPITYSRLDIRIQRQFKLDTTVSLYEWCNRYRDNPSKRTTIMTWEMWRWSIFGEIDENSIYNEYKIFKREKLTPAIKEINETSDLEISLIEDRDGGRKIKTLQFTVQPKQLFIADGDIEKDKLNDSISLLESLGIKKVDIRKITQKYSPEVISVHYEFVKERIADKRLKPLQDIPAYFKYAIENGLANAKLNDIKNIESTENKLEAMTSIEQKFMSARNDEARDMFNEMHLEMQQSFINEFNDEQKIEEARIPLVITNRQQRHLIPFYSWLAKKTWGDPTAQEIFNFAMENELIMLNKK